jgi:hypothetical protein
MRKGHRLFVLFAGVFPLVGCGQYLGSYAVEEAHVVTGIPKSHMGSPPPSYGQYLEIRLASKTNLTSLLPDVTALYVGADFCPLRNDDGLIAFGPYSDDAQDLSEPHDARPLKAANDGLFRYHLYVVVAYKAQRATQPGQVQLPTYDLKRSNRDLCLRLFAPGYNLTRSRSDMIRVPARMLSTALKRTPAGRSS